MYDDRAGEPGDLFLLEVNTQPGMMPLSLVPEQASYVGIEFDVGSLDSGERFMRWINPQHENLIWLNAPQTCANDQCHAGPDVFFGVLAIGSLRFLVGGPARWHSGWIAALCSQSCRRRSRAQAKRGCALKKFCFRVANIVC